jgi:iron complex transport system substrate-binding protein
VRVVSLLPAATEIVAALGMTDALVGVSHECDHPPAVRDKPRVTHCPIHGGALDSDAVDRWVTDTLATTGTLYTLAEELVRDLQPDVILTQRLCDVCAVAYDSVAAFAATLPGPPRVVNLEPSTLADIMADIARVGTALGVPERATRLVHELTARVDAVRAHSDGAPRRRCVLLEWIAPPFRTGHWGPELIEIAGGSELLGRPGEDAARISWDAVRDAAPDVLILACCGYDLARTLADVPLLTAQPGWKTLPAVRSGEVYALDGSAYVSRPGPRIVDSLEILAGILHPDRFPGRIAADACMRIGADALSTHNPPTT